MCHFREALCHLQLQLPALPFHPQCRVWICDCYASELCDCGFQVQVTVSKGLQMPHITFRGGHKDRRTFESDHIYCLVIMAFTSPTTLCCSTNFQAPPKAPPTLCWVQTPALVLGCLLVKPDLPTGFRHTPGHQPWDWNKFLLG